VARIELDRLSLTFKVRQYKKLPIKDLFVQQMFRRSVNPLNNVEALKDLNLVVEEGDRLGVIGHNGAGKSTLLRLIAGIYPPTHGRCIVEGRISSLFDVAFGFQGDADGWENIRLRGYLQGETPRTMRSKIDAVAEFSELGKFLNMPVRNYSSGMLVRLGFAISTMIDPTILLVDEILGAGDMAFQNKARERMMALMDRAKLIVMVAHDLASISTFCNRVAWMEQGRVRQIGRPEEVVAAYTRHMGTLQAAKAA
jgi:ABC-type polysaccharide/polyol phosphate transport system ATPase subunit